eukprot:gene2402-3400_t
MSAYVVGQINIIDPLKWQEYRDQVPGTLAAWNAELVFRGVKTADLALQNAFSDIVMIRFPTLDAAHGWFQSNAYQALIPLRETAAQDTDPKSWWSADPKFDEQIRLRYGETLLKAAKSEFFSWRASARGRLAEIIVLDQFSRN